LLQTQNQRIQNQAKELTFWEKVGDILGRTTRVGGQRAAAKGSITTEEQIAISQGQQAEAALRERIASLQLTLEGLVNPGGGTSTSARGKDAKVNPLTGEQYDKEQESIRKHFEELFNIDAENKIALQDAANIANEEFLNSELVKQARQNQIERDGAKTRERIAEQEAQAKRQAYMLAADGFISASHLIGQETAAGKALSVAATLIATYLSAQKAYLSQLTLTPDSPIRAQIAAASAIAFGLGNVRQILSVAGQTFRRRDCAHANCARWSPAGIGGSLRGCPTQTARGETNRGRRISAGNTLPANAGAKCRTLPSRAAV
jgi:hypothetical protein